MKSATREVERAGNKAGGIDFGAFAEEDAVRIEQEDLAGGVELAVVSEA